MSSPLDAVHVSALAGCLAWLKTDIDAWEELVQ